MRTKISGVILLLSVISALAFTETLVGHSDLWMWTDKEVYGRGEIVSVYFQNLADSSLKTDQSWIEFLKNGTWVKIFSGFTVISEVRPGNIVGFGWTQIGNETDPYLPSENMHQVPGGSYRALWKIRHVNGSKFATFNATFKIADIMIPDDYPTIQTAINNANPRDTIFVRAGTYYENLVINKTVMLIGEDKVNTIIDGNKSNIVVSVLADNVSVCEFSVRNGGGTYAGISLSSKGTQLRNNVLSKNWCGIRLESGSAGNLIANNTIMDNLNGISGELCSNTRIIGNVLMDNTLGIRIGSHSTNNTIAFNNIRDHWSEGLSIWQSNYNVFFGNNITGNNQGGHWAGITIGGSSSNTFFHNNIVDNGRQVDLQGDATNTWDHGYPLGGNYWSDYTGTDLYQGSYQNITGSDGIGDKEYIINERNIDRYPLTCPWGTKPIPPPVKRSVGVKVGDWAKYEVTANYTTNDPDPPIPPLPKEATEIEYYKAEVESISGTNITFQTVIRFRNGTETSWKMWTDVASALSHSFPTLFIAANLSVGDTVYSEPYSRVINATLIRRYSGAEREVNYIGQRSNYTSPYPSFRQVSEMHVYWDRATGALTEWIQEIEYTNLRQGFVTYTYTHLKVKETNLWEREEEVIVDTRFSPSVLNVNGKGRWIIAFVRIPREYTNKDVDVSSILLNGTVIPSKVRRVGHYRLLVMFKRAEVVDLVKAVIQHENRHRMIAVSLTISGKLHDGTIIEGTDTIRILQRCHIHKHHNIPAPCRADHPWAHMYINVVTKSAH